MFVLLPVVFSVLFSKTLTFIAFGSIPVSLTLTVKSASPLFSVALEKIISGRSPSGKACLALIPIALGVTMSTISEVHFAWTGLLAAATSTLMVVGQTMYTKHCLDKYENLDPLLLHLYTSATAMLIVVPYLIYTAVTFYLAHPGFAHSPMSLSHPIDLVDPTAIASALQPLLITLLGVGCVYIQNMSSLAFLHATSTISHQVATTCNKFFVIVATIFVFHEAVSTTNVVGFVVAGMGFLCYTSASSQDKVKKMHDLEEAITDVEMSQTSLACKKVAVKNDVARCIPTRKADIELGAVSSAPAALCKSPEALLVDSKDSKDE